MGGKATCECGFAVPCRSIVVHLCRQLAAQKPLPCGPGCHLKRMLARFGITATESCACNAHAAQMDAWGADGCVQHKHEIVGWLRDEAKSLGLPFIKLVATRLIDAAVRASREEQKREDDEAHI